LTRTSRPNIPRFRFDFKHAKRDLGDHVHRKLVDAFLNKYLEIDGYFFIRLLTANTSDFIVQEVLEQLWTVYVMKYGEHDAQHAEKTFYEFRNQSSVTLPASSISASYQHVTNRMIDAKRKYSKTYSDANLELLNGTSKFQPALSVNDERQESV
jgi:hypothetical protein